MLWVIIILLIISLVLYLLFATLSIYIDTDNNHYYIHLKGICKLSAESHKTELLKLRFQFFFLNFNFYPLRLKKKTKSKKKLKKSKRLLTAQRGFRIARTFKIKRFLVDLDTGDCITNAKLFPVFTILNYKLGNFHLNFEGKNRLELLIENRPIYIIKSFINL